MISSHHDFRDEHAQVVDTDMDRFRAAFADMREQSEPKPPSLALQDVVSALDDPETDVLSLEAAHSIAETPAKTECGQSDMASTPVFQDPRICTQSHESRELVEQHARPKMADRVAQFTGRAVARTVRAARWAGQRVEVDKKAAAASEGISKIYEKSTGRDSTTDYQVARYASMGAAAVGGTMVAASYAAAAVGTAAVAGVGYVTARHYAGQHIDEAMDSEAWQKTKEATGSAFTGTKRFYAGLKEGYSHESTGQQRLEGQRDYCERRGLDHATVFQDSPPSLSGRVGELRSRGSGEGSAPRSVLDPAPAQPTSSWLKACVAPCLPFVASPYDVEVSSSPAPWDLPGASGATLEAHAAARGHPMSDTLEASDPFANAGNSTAGYAASSSEWSRPAEDRGALHDIMINGFSDLQLTRDDGPGEVPSIPPAESPL